MKKIIVLFLAAMLILALCACQAPDDGKVRVGVCQLAPHPALDQATAGFKDALIEAFGEDGVDVIIKNANNQTSDCVSIINSLISSRVDLIMANATPALQAAANSTREIPILGTSVTEYGVALGIENFSGTVGGNVSGTSDLADLKQQAEMILKWCPDAKQVALLYCSAEPNSLYQVQKIAEYLGQMGVQTQEFAFVDTNDMSGHIQKAADWGDAIYVPTDNTVADNATLIDSICRGKIPVFAGEEGICANCGVATLSISYYELGYTTGQMAVRILKDGGDISQMAIEYAPQVTAKYSAERCELLGLTPVEGYIPLG